MDMPAFQFVACRGGEVSVLLSNRSMRRSVRSDHGRRPVFQRYQVGYLTPAARAAATGPPYCCSIRVIFSERSFFMVDQILLSELFFCNGKLPSLY